MKHEGKQIVMSGKPGETGIIPFQHTDKYGVTKTIALRLNKAYAVGGNDENGEIIEDWVYDLFLTCDYNNNRQKTKSEIRSEKSLMSEDSPKVNNQIGFIN